MSAVAALAFLACVIAANLPRVRSWLRAAEAPTPWMVPA